MTRGSTLRLGVMAAVLLSACGGSSPGSGSPGGGGSGGGGGGAGSSGGGGGGGLVDSGAETATVGLGGHPTPTPADLAAIGPGTGVGMSYMRFLFDHGTDYLCSCRVNDCDHVDQSGARPGAVWLLTQTDGALEVAMTYMHLTDTCEGGIDADDGFRCGRVISDTPDGYEIYLVEGQIIRSGGTITSLEATLTVTSRRPGLFDCDFYSKAFYQYTP